MGKDWYDKVGNLRLKYFVHDNILHSLNKKARNTGWNKPLFIKLCQRMIFSMIMVMVSAI